MRSRADAKSRGRCAAEPNRRRRRDEDRGHEEDAWHQRQGPRGPVQTVPARRECREGWINRVREVGREKFGLERTRHKRGEEPREHERAYGADDESPPCRPPVRGERDEQEQKDDWGHDLPERGAVVPVLTGVHRERAWRGLRDRANDHHDREELRTRLQERPDGGHCQREVRDQVSCHSVVTPK